MRDAPVVPNLEAWLYPDKDPLVVKSPCVKERFTRKKKRVRGPQVKKCAAGSFWTRWPACRGTGGRFPLDWVDHNQGNIHAKAVKTPPYIFSTVLTNIACFALWSNA
jgi:hypothetical protein